MNECASNESVLGEMKCPIMNCWDFKRCGCREFCSAYPSNGRRCALVLGTLCNGEKQDNFKDKLYHCLKCDFFRSEYHVRYVD
jgi:hypothetical protein